MRGILMGVLFLISGSAIAGVRTCDVPEALENARKAKAILQSKLTFSANGINGIGITNCGAFWYEKVLGLKHIAVMRPAECGVSLGFATQEVQMEFARISHGHIRIATDVSVRVCGGVTGIIKPQQ